MAATRVTLADIGRDPAQVARELVAWQRGEPDEAARQTLAASAGEMNRSRYTLWAWEGRTSGDEPALALPITADQAAAFAPPRPAAVLARCVEAALALGADPAAVRLEDWRGYTCVVAPGMDPELAGAALEEAHAPAGRARVAALPEGVRLGGPPIALDAGAGARGGGLAAIGRELSLHPVRVLLALAGNGLPTAATADDAAGLTRSLRELGVAGEPPVAVPEIASLAIDDDPCPRRRHARRVLRRLLQKGKIGGYHTEIGHLTRGLPDHDKRDAKELVEELLRAGILIEKPSVGQRHISLNRESLPQIHALIERGATLDAQLAEAWTAPAPGETGATASPAPSPSPPERSGSR